MGARPRVRRRSSLPIIASQTTTPAIASYYISSLPSYSPSSPAHCPIPRPPAPTPLAAQLPHARQTQFRGFSVCSRHSTPRAVKPCDCNALASHDKYLCNYWRKLSARYRAGRFVRYHVFPTARPAASPRPRTRASHPHVPPSTSSAVAEAVSRCRSPDAGSWGAFCRPVDWRSQSASGFKASSMYVYACRSGMLQRLSNGVGPSRQSAVQLPVRRRPEAPPVHAAADLQR